MSQLLLPPNCTKMYGAFCNQPPWKICSNNFPRNFHLVTGCSDSFPKGLCASHVKLKDLSTLAEQIKNYSSFQIYYTNIAFHPLPLPYEDWLYHWQDSPTRGVWSITSSTKESSDSVHKRFYPRINVMEDVWETTATKKDHIPSGHAFI